MSARLKGILTLWTIAWFHTLAATASAIAEQPILQIESGGHMALIRALEVTPDGRRLISAGDDKTIRIWDIETGNLLRVLRGEIGADDHGKIYALAISPDGRWLAAGGPTGAQRAADHPIRLYDLQSGEIVRLLHGHHEPVLALDFSPDGSMLASGSMDDTGLVFDPRSGGQLLQVKGHKGDVNAVRFSRDGRRLVTASDDHSLALWDLSSGRMQAHMKGHAGIVFDAVFSPDGQHVASSSEDGSVRIWDAFGGDFIRALQSITGAVMKLAYSSDGASLIAGSGTTPFAVPIWNLADGSVRNAYEGHDNLVLSARFLPMAGLAVSAGGNNNVIDIWKIDSGDRVARLAGIGQSVFSARFSDSGHEIAWGHSRIRQKINAWGAPEYRMRLPQPGRPSGEPAKLQSAGLSFYPVATAADGARLEISASPGSSFYDVLKLQRGADTIAHIQRSEKDGYAHNAFALSAGHSTIITGGGSGWLRGYDSAGRHVRDYTGHTGDIWAVATSPDERFLLSASDDQTLSLWNMQSGELLVSLFHGQDGQWVWWTPQGYFNASPNGDDLIGWHVNKGADRAAEFITAAQLKQHFYRPHVVDQSILRANAVKAATLADGSGFSLDKLSHLAPPRFQVTDVQPILENGRIRLRLNLSIEASQHRASRLGVVVNGRNTYSSNVRLPDATGGVVSIEVAGAPGRNLIEINLGNAIGVSTERIAVAAPTVAERVRNRLFVLAVGVNDYVEFKQDLSFAAADAKAILDHFVLSAGNMHETAKGRLLADGTDTDPTTINIRNALKLLSQAGPDDTTILFLAGHGVNQGPDYLFLPSDARQVDGLWQSETVIEWKDLQAAFAATKGRRILVIDTCHAANAFNPRLIKDAEDANITVLAATDADTLAHEQADLGHGVFTYALIQGLNGQADTNKDRKIQASELGQYVQRTVSELTQRRQQPVLHLPVSGDFTLGTN